MTPKLKKQTLKEARTQDDTIPLRIQKLNFHITMKTLT
jgi:hypothetical protein